MESGSNGVKFYERSTCTADTATNGYTRTIYTDSACTVESTTGEPSVAKPTGTCTDQGVGTFELYGCTSTSATLGAMKYTKHSAAGCADSTLTESGYRPINFCEVDSDNNAYEKSEKSNIVNGQISFGQWPASMASKDCSATGFTVLGALYPDDVCRHGGEHDPDSWNKYSAVIDGASVPGYSTLSSTTSGNTPTTAPTDASTIVSQGITISGLESSEYTGTVQTNYEKGYGQAVGACTSPCSSYNTGVSVTSSATGRRATIVTFVMTLSSGVADTYSSGCSGTCTSATLQTELIASTGASITVDAMTTASVTTEAPTTAGNTATSAAISVFLGVVCTVLNLMFC